MRGQRSGNIIVILVVGAALFLFGLFALAMLAMSTNNRCVVSENGIEAQYDQNRNNYDNYFKKLKETAQVPDMYTEDLKKLYDGAMSGRYGANGSKAVFQFIKEQNPTLDSGLYRQIQQVIEAGRNSFEADQKSLIAKKQAYKDYLRSQPSGFFSGLLGFPKIDFNKYDIVTSDETEETFKKKKSAPLKLRDKESQTEQESK